MFKLFLLFIPVLLLSGCGEQQSGIVKDEFTGSRTILFHCSLAEGTESCYIAADSYKDAFHQLIDKVEALEKICNAK